MGMLPPKKLDYSDGRTLQTFKDETDINKLLVRAQRAGTLSHLEKYEGVYGDFSDIDGLLDAHGKLQKLNEIFSQLPGELRKEFDQSPAKFAAFVNHPDNVGKLHKIFPALAEPGRQNIDVSGKTAPAVASEPKASENKATAPPPEGSPSAPQASSQEA